MNLKLPKYNLNHTRPIVGYGNFSYTSPKESDTCMVDPSIVERKFKIWQYVLENKLLTSKDEYIRLKAWSLLKDKSIFGYNYFKFNNAPLKLRFYQDAILSDTHDRILFAAANQIGKSMSLDVDAAIEFLSDHKRNWIGILVSNSLDQSMYRMDMIKMMLRSANINYRDEDTSDTKTGKKDNATKVSYTFYSSDGKTPLYTNLLICCPHTSSALGYAANNIWLDEFDFWQDVKGGQEHFLNQVIIPRTYETEGTIKVFSNPDGKDKLLYKLWNQTDTEGKPVWNRYQFNYWDKPGSTQSKFNRNIIGKTRQQVESTLLAVFSQSAGAFLSTQEIEDSIDKELCQKGQSAGYGKETAWFLDVGSAHDQSCLVGAYITQNDNEPEIPLINVFFVHKYPVGYPLSRLVGIDDTVDDGWKEDSDNNPSVKEVLTQYSETVNGDVCYPMFGVDVTGNSGILPLFNNAGIEPIDLTFSGKKKWQMYQRMQYYFQQRYIKRVLDQDMNTVNGKDGSYQLSKLVVKKGTSTNYRQVHHENEDDYDDYADSLAGVVFLIDNPDLPSLSFDIINHGESQLEAIEEERAEIKQLKENNPELKDQYIPSFYKSNEVQSWIDKKESERK